MRFLGGAEAASRLDDWIRLGVPLLAAPNRQRDLVETESWGSHGKPHGRYRKWQLNDFGFRSPPMDRESDPARPRILILGASETFGLYESADMEYPAQLARRLEKQYEVVNAAMAGITLKSMLPYWDNWAGHFGARKVLIYPSPMFYLDDTPPELPKESIAKELPGGRFQLRLAGRLKDVYHSLPAWVRGLREQWVVDEQSAGKDAGWTFTSVPPNRLALFREDLESLVCRIRRSGAEPILLTHAVSAAWPPRAEDEAYLRAMRMFFPRATSETLVEFERQANRIVRDLAGAKGLVLIDVDGALSGRRELFADMVHFNDAGATELADLLARRLAP